ncbi:hypothetical protein ACWIGM_21860 [Bosea sp. NPDC055332]
MKIHNLTEKDVFLIIYRYIQINYERCSALDLVDILSAMMLDDNDLPWDAGTTEDLRQAMEDLANGKIATEKFRKDPA